MDISDNKEKQHSLDVAEDSREQDWKLPSFTAELFQGRFRWDLIHPYPDQSAEDKAIGDKLLVDLEAVLRKHIDPEKIDRTGEMPKSALKALADKGFFGMKISKEYGGLGVSIFNYARAMQLVGSWCGSTAVWLSAHQSIGVPQPLALFGTLEQKQKYLPRLAKGAISAFALTEPDVGSDPAKMSTTATLSEDGAHYILNGEKLYCTNGPAAELIVVMAATPSIKVRGQDKKQITAFILETDSPGFEVVHKCSFMGIRGISNGLLRFNNIKVPKENMIGELGQGLKIALVTLNAGRLTIPAVSTGVGKLCMTYLQKWGNERVQWGQPIGQHEAVGARLAKMTADTFAMESVSFITASFADRKNADIRLEAAMAKYFGSEVAYKIADDTLQTRGGRGFETSESLRARGEDAVPIERILRDLRINRIIEGTSDIMQLFIAREAMDIHVRYIMGVLDKHKSLKEKSKLAGKAALFYTKWYPMQWMPNIPSFQTKHLSRQNISHLNYINRTAKQLARSLFHTMGLYQQKLEKEQLILAAYVDIGTYLFAMAASLSRAEMILSSNPDESVQDVVNLFCTEAREIIEDRFNGMGHHHRKLLGKVNAQFLKGRYEWMITDIMRDGKNT